MRIILRDIFLMDRGNAGNTGFKWDEEIVKYRMNNEGSDEWLVGHIHSHHNMTVFFSPVDMSELNDNAPNHNIYLSIIVNNNLDIMGKLVVYAESLEQMIKRKYSCKDEEGRDYIIELGESKIKPPDGMLIYDCEMLYDKPKTDVDEEFISRIEVVLKEANERDDKKREQPAKNWSYQPHPYPQSTLPNKINVNYSNPRENLTPYLDPNPNDINQYKKEDLLEAFGGYVLRMGTFVESDTISDALSDIAIANINESAVAYIINRQYMRMFAVFFKDMSSTSRIAIYDVALKYIIDEVLRTDDPSELEIHEAATLIDCFLDLQKMTEMTSTNY